METLRLTFLCFIGKAGVVETQLGLPGNGVDAAIVKFLAVNAEILAGNPRHRGDP